MQPSEGMIGVFAGLCTCECPRTGAPGCTSHLPDVRRSRPVNGASPGRPGGRLGPCGAKASRKTVQLVVTGKEQGVALIFSSDTYAKNRSEQPGRSVGGSLGGIHPMRVVFTPYAELARAEEPLLKVLVVGECGSNKRSTFMT